MTTPASYHALRGQIQGLLTEGQRKTETYRYIGDALLSHISGQERARLWRDNNT